MAVCEGGMRPQRRSSWRCSEAGIRASRLGYAGAWRYPRMPREMQYWNSCSWTWRALCSSCQSISRSNIRPGPPCVTHPFVWGQPKGMAGLYSVGVIRKNVADKMLYTKVTFSYDHPLQMRCDCSWRAWSSVDSLSHRITSSSVVQLIQQHTVLSIKLMLTTSAEQSCLFILLFFVDQHI